MTADVHPPVISVMLAVTDAAAAARWYAQALGATELWNPGGVVRDHQAPWGVHRQGGFIDPFGHLWLVGDRSPLGTYHLR